MTPPLSLPTSILLAMYTLTHVYVSKYIPHSFSPYRRRLNIVFSTLNTSLSIAISLSLARLCFEFFFILFHSSKVFILFDYHIDILNVAVHKKTAVERKKNRVQQQWKRIIGTGSAQKRENQHHKKKSTSSKKRQTSTHTLTKRHRGEKRERKAVLYTHTYSLLCEHSPTCFIWNSACIACQS